MRRHKIGLATSGIANMKAICDLLNIGVDPISTFQEYTDIVGRDLNGQNVEAGFPIATWVWETMPQRDFEYLLAFTNQSVYIRTRNNSGASGFDFANYLCYANRPTGELSEENPLVRHNISISFMAMIVQ